MRLLFELGPVTQRHVQTPVRGAVGLRARSVGIDDGSVIRDDRQLLVHRFLESAHMLRIPSEEPSVYILVR